ncbi:hypothetical protein SAMN02910298_00220 [Pseudobutyrivibrio sp. YE44]|uniref:AAA family ATPase n=1 Tax=Pseudobutyrivibrio sp. YE44 TaxID=1520802 RepID=UPI00088A6570|nr:AAA family ATPase [Pseudobutyrivibrio sp. YE44]SDB07074.1 hypothetical protein SAMN02910298_00220 [Pseudobutyrivibrio sp. YE44]
MSITLWPREYEKKSHIIPEEKALLRIATKNFKEGHFVVGIDPLGMCTNENHMGLYISPEEGLITFSIYTGDFIEKMIDSYIMMVKMYEDKIYNRLLDSKVLISRVGESKILKFPYKHIMVFSNEDRLKMECSIENRKLISEYATARNFTPIDNTDSKLKLKDLHLFRDIRKPYDANFIDLSEVENAAIFERLAPEYAVVIPEKEHITISDGRKTGVSDEDLLITGNESEFKTFFLDDDQVNIVNDMGKGHRVLLANPGAGKSVLLLSKAFKYASMYKDSKVLLTCFNNNLADSYVFKYSCANFGDNRNLYILTLHKLVKKLFNDCLGRGIEGNIATPEEIDECIRLVKNGNIKQRFKAIFIDEVQIFEPKYLELCYALLESPVEDSLFLMAGDLNQTVRSQSRRGDAPWKKIEGVNLDFKGRVRYVKKNYRNTKEIGEYLNAMLKYMNQKMENLGIMIPSEYDYDSFEVNDRPSIALKVKTGVTRNNIVDEVLKSLFEIVNSYDVAYSDIAIIFPYRQMKNLKYYFMYWLEREFNQMGIPYCTIISSEGDKYRRYSQTSGVVLTTIDSSLGLDFKAVIVAGLYPYNFVYSESGAKSQVKSWEQVEKFGPEMKERFMLEVRKTYTAASRAREILYVISDVDEGTPLNDVIQE